MSSNPIIDSIEKALLAPFDPREIKWKPQAISGNRALAIAYVDARVVQDRLDEVLGVTGWQDDYEFLPDGSVVCRLRLRLEGEWIAKTDVGGQSEQPDEGDRRKAAVSDALKRAAVKFGVGRYLYRLPSQWVDYDPQKKQFTRVPTLPASALPGRSNGAAAKAKKDIKDGPALEAWLLSRDKALSAAGRCNAGELIRYLAVRGKEYQWPDEIVRWPVPQCLEGVRQWVSEFQKGHPERPAPPQPEHKPDTAPAGQPEMITGSQANALVELLAKKRLSWDFVRSQLNLGRLASIDTLQSDVYAEVMAAVQQEPDREPARK